MRWSLIGYLGGAAAPRARHLPGFVSRVFSYLPDYKKVMCGSVVSM
jgi:hypothetical protein